MTRQHDPDADRLYRRGMPLAFTHSPDHENCIGLRPVGDDDELFHISEWHYATRLLLSSDVPTVAFFAFRHLTELVLKRILREVTGQAPSGHELVALLEALPPDDPLRVGSDEPEQSIRELIAAIEAVDKRSTAARYAFDQSEQESFSDDACIERDVIGVLAGTLWDYCLVRAGGWHGPDELLA